MAEVDPQEFGEVKANVNTITQAMGRIETKLDNVVTTETLKNSVRDITDSMKSLDERVTDVDKRLQTVEGTLLMQRGTLWSKVKTSMQSTVVTIITYALVFGLGTMVVTYFTNYMHSQVKEDTSGKS